MSILLWLLILIVATAWHELGHYWLARAQGVGVRSFSVGMGPVLARFRARGTEWRLSALPIGGYVDIDGMAPQPDAQGRIAPPKSGFASLSTPGKVAILLAGPLFNWILAVALLSANFATQGVTTPLPGRARIEQVVDNSRAQQLGLRAGDVIVAIGGEALPKTYQVNGQARPGYLKVQDALATDGPKSLTVERDGRRFKLNFDWQASENGRKRLLGISYAQDRLVSQVGLGAAVAAAARTSVTVVPQALSAFGSLFQRFFSLNLRPEEGVVGPVGAINIVGQAAKAGFWSVVGFAAVINLSLALFNLLPIPGLDGGRILIVLVQRALRRRLSFDQENLINFAGLALVMLLMAFVVLRDVVTLF